MAHATVAVAPVPGQKLTNTPSPQWEISRPAAEIIPRRPEAMIDREAKAVYWHRELPPVEAELVAEHTVEAKSGRVPGTLAHRDDLWDRCYRELMADAHGRLVQETARLGGDFAHVHSESIEPKHDDAAGEAWLHGRFDYMLYRRPRNIAGRGHV